MSRGGAADTEDSKAPGGEGCRCAPVQRTTPCYAGLQVPGAQGDFAQLQPEELLLPGLPREFGPYTLVFGFHKNMGYSLVSRFCEDLLYFVF